MSGQMRHDSHFIVRVICYMNVNLPSTYYAPAFTWIIYISLLNNSDIGALIIPFHRRSRDLGGEEACLRSQSKKQLSQD